MEALEGMTELENVDLGQLVDRASEGRKGTYLNFIGEVNEHDTARGFLSASTV